MVNSIYLKTVLSETNKATEQQLILFALLNLGILDSLANGTISSSDALQIFFHADNCLFVHRSLHNRQADDIMSRGIQLSDLFDILPPKEAQREFQREVATMRALCLSLLEEKQLAA